MKVPLKQTTDMSKYPRLPEMQPLLVEIVRPVEGGKPNPEYIEDTYKGEKKNNVRIRMVVVEGPYAGNPADPENQPPGMVFGKHGLTINSSGKGEKSMLRQIVDAVHDRDLTDAEAADVDIDHLVGRRLTVIGKYAPTKPGEDPSPYLKPIAYGRATPQQRGLTTSTAAPVAPPANGDYQYSPDGALRWKPGMGGWEPVPAPPPLPAAPAPPPLPAAPPLAAAAASAAAPPPPLTGGTDF